MSGANAFECHGACPVVVYWASWTKNQHSQNIATNNNVFATIYDSTAAEGTGRGVYMQGTAREIINTKEIEHAVATYYSRKNKTARSVSDFNAPAPRRMYCFTPENVWINVEDQKLPIDLRETVSLI